MTDKLSDKEINDLLEAVSKEEYRDKDYSVLEGMERDSVSKMRTAFDKGYKQGYETGVATQGFVDGYTEEEVERREKEAYQKGLEKAWETAKYIVSLTGNDVKRREIIGDCAAWYAFTHYTASEVIANIEAYEQKQKQGEIKVGDEVYLIDECHPRVVTCITKINGENPTAVQFTESGRWVADDVTELHKTGRHFDQIEEVLKALKEGDPE